MGLLSLLVQSAIMSAGTYGVGVIPLSIHHQRHHAATSSTPSSGESSSSWIARLVHGPLVSTFSVGLLVSTALCVIIPEGVAVMVRSVQSGKEGEREGEVHEHVDDGDDLHSVGTWIGLALVLGFLLMRVNEP
jgi:hypothetical protein